MYAHVGFDSIRAVPCVLAAKPSCINNNPFSPLSACSPGRYAPCRCLHPPPAQWGEELWSQTKQALRPQNNAPGYTKVLRDTCRPTLLGMCDDIIVTLCGGHVMCHVMLFQVFHKIITSGLPRLQPLYDCLLTVLVNGKCYNIIARNFGTDYMYM